MTVALKSFAFNAATFADFKNWNKDLKGFIGNAYVHILLSKFETLKKISNGAFFYDYDTDECGKLSKLFWADGIGRRNYDVFCDVIPVDATFHTNK